MVIAFEKIVVDKKEEAKFRRRALRRYPDEYMEVLYGLIKEGTLYICAFVPVEHTASRRRVHYEHEELDFHEEDAKEHGMLLLGTIHTHPDLNHAVPSEGDLHDCLQTQETVMGICAIETKGEGEKRHRHCQIQYWPRYSPITVEYRDWNAQRLTSKASTKRD